VSYDASLGLRVLKFGGELVEDPVHVGALAVAVASLAADGPLVVVHGGGREIDVELMRRGIAKLAVDGVRVTDAATLDAVTAVLAGTVNTRLVAALVAAGASAVGLTGVDDGLARATKAAPYHAVSGQMVDLGLVGEPVDSSPSSLIADLVSRGYLPVVASLGVDESGQVLNINADTLAAHIARMVGARTLWLVGATSGVLDQDGRAVPFLGREQALAMIADGSASRGMVAKLNAALGALDAGVPEVLIVDGRDPARLADAPGTRLSVERSAAELA
jgi:acetylglutamate kinase